MAKINPNLLMELAETDEFINANDELVENYLRAINTEYWTRTDDEDEIIQVLHGRMIEALQQFYDSLLNRKNPWFTFNQTLTLNTTAFQEANENLVKQYYVLWQQLEKLESGYLKTNLTGLLSPEYIIVLEKLQSVAVEIKVALNNFTIPN